MGYDAYNDLKNSHSSTTGENIVATIIVFSIVSLLSGFIFGLFYYFLPKPNSFYFPYEWKNTYGITECTLNNKVLYENTTCSGFGYAIRPELTIPIGIFITSLGFIFYNFIKRVEFVIKFNFKK